MDITGTILGGGNSDGWYAIGVVTGAFSRDISMTRTQHLNTTQNTATGNFGTSFKASRSWTGVTSSSGSHTHTSSNTIYGNSTTVTPYTCKTYMIIKY